MSNFILSANMNLPIPVVGVDPGPDYSLNVDACLAKIDSHNHSSGQGVQINPNGININADLAINNNNLTLIRSVRFNPQASNLSLGTDLGCLYESGVDLFYNDGNGNQIRLTQSGSIVGTAGSISGLPSGTASASFSAGTFVWQSATSVAANMDFQSAIIRNSSANSNGITLSAPNLLPSNYQLTLPSALPGSTQALNLDSSGNIGTISYDNIGVSMTSTGANAIVNTSSSNYAVSLAIPNSITSSVGSITNITNASATITLTGNKLVLIKLISNGVSGCQTSVQGGGGGVFIYYSINGGPNVEYDYPTVSGQNIPISIDYIDTQFISGSATIVLKFQTTSSASLQLTNTKLLVMEI